MLNVSRTFGDMHYKLNPDLSPKKQLVISVPEICEQPRSKDVDFVFIACDGIWECMDSVDVTDFLNDQMKKSSKSKKRSSKLSHMIENLFMKNIAQDLTTGKPIIHNLLEGKGRDNMTGILIQFKQIHQSEIF